MKVNLRTARVDQLARAVFDHPAAQDSDQAWYCGDVDFEIAPGHQVGLLAELFRGAPSHFLDYPADQIEEGLWCMMDAVHHEMFCGLVWNPALPLSGRLRVVSGVFTVYDKVLAPYPYEAIDFEHPDTEPRRFRTIDYMAPDLLLKSPWLPSTDKAAAAAVQAAFLDLFSRLLTHPAPVAQYAGLHGLGHLEHPDRAAVIDQYLDTWHWLDPAQRDYAEAARRGDIL